MPIKFGPAGLGSIKEAVSNLERYHKLGLKACEIAFTYSIYIKRKKDAIKIGKKARELNIELTIHAPYWINLNSKEKEKIKKSKQRILKCCEIGTWLKAKRIIFHPGYYGRLDKQETYENIKKAILEIQKQAKKQKFTPKLAPETSGKVNVFGSIEEIKKLVKETKCDFCIDFAHILSRYKSYKFKEILKKFKRYRKWHVHFSGIEYNKKGERHHKKTSTIDMKKLLSNLPKNKDIILINESPFPIKDSVLGLSLYKE
ncbi:endonuclease IV [Candidatus Pacearchaeota archaeon]|nr:MAG: endonuclease IV [Candidatus Pacearchaeota archaeon]